jgi:GNAT superfamily N-acetyltransferase
MYRCGFIHGLRGASASRWRRKAPRIREAIRYDSVTGLLAKALGHVAYRRVVLVGRRLDVPPPDARSDLELAVRALTPEEVESYARFRADADGPTVLKRLAAGSLVYAAWHEGRIVSAAWVDRGTAQLDPIGVRLRLHPLDVYGRDSYTVPDLRGHNVATVRMVEALRALHADGYECFFGFVLPENRRAFGPPAKAGLDRLGSAGWFGLGPLRLYFVAFAGSRARIHARFKRPGRPVEVDLGRPCHRSPEQRGEVMPRSSGR